MPSLQSSSSAFWTNQKPGRALCLPEFPPGLRRFRGFVTPASRRWCQPELQEGQILRILAQKHFDASSHESASQFVGCSRFITELQLALPESQMQERIPDGIRAVHGRGQIIPPRLKIPVEKVGVIDRDKQPGCCIPLCLWFRQQIPRSPVLLGGCGLSGTFGQYIPFGSEFLNVLVTVIRQLRHKRWSLHLFQLTVARMADTVATLILRVTKVLLTQLPIDKLIQPDCVAACKLQICPGWRRGVRKTFQCCI